MTYSTFQHLTQTAEFEAAAEFTAATINPNRRTYRQCDGGCGAQFEFTHRDPREKVPAFCVRCQKPVNWIRIHPAQEN